MVSDRPPISLPRLPTTTAAKIYAFTRPGDKAAQAFARELGAVWASGSDSPAPTQLDAAIIFAPDGGLVPKALKDLKEGGCCRVRGNSHE